MFLVLEEGPLSKFKINIKSENYEQEGEDGMCCSLIFTYTPKYPDETPEIDVEDAENLEDEHIEQLKSHLLEQVLRKKMYLKLLIICQSECLIRLNFRLEKI